MHNCVHHMPVGPAGRGRYMRSYTGGARGDRHEYVHTYIWQKHGHGMGSNTHTHTHLQITHPLNPCVALCDTACIWGNEHLLGPQHHRPPPARPRATGSTTPPPLSLSLLPVAIMSFDTSYVAPYDLSSPAAKHAKTPLNANPTHGYTLRNPADTLRDDRGRSVT